MTMPADPQSQALLTAALADQRVLALVPSPGKTDPTGDVIIELPDNDRLGVLLNDLHMISSHVFVSSVDHPLPASVGGIAEG